MDDELAMKRIWQMKTDEDINEDTGRCRRKGWYFRLEVKDQMDDLDPSSWEDVLFVLYSTYVCGQEDSCVLFAGELRFSVEKELRHVQKMKGMSGVKLMRKRDYKGLRRLEKTLVIWGFKGEKKRIWDRLPVYISRRINEKERTVVVPPYHMGEGGTVVDNNWTGATDEVFAAVRDNEINYDATNRVFDVVKGEYMEPRWMTEEEFKDFTLDVGDDLFDEIWNMVYQDGSVGKISTDEKRRRIMDAKTVVPNMAMPYQEETQNQMEEVEGKRNAFNGQMYDYDDVDWLAGRDIIN